MAAPEVVLPWPEASTPTTVSALAGRLWVWAGAVNAALAWLFTRSQVDSDKVSELTATGCRKRGSAAPPRRRRRRRRRSAAAAAPSFGCPRSQSNSFARAHKSAKALPRGFFTPDRCLGSCPVWANARAR